VLGLELQDPLVLPNGLAFLAPIGQNGPHSEVGLGQIGPKAERLTIFPSASSGFPS